MPESQIYLDESGENAPLDGFKVIETEIDFLRHDGISERLWIRGSELCDYVRLLYQSRQQKINESASPRSFLRPLIGEASDKISPALVTRLLAIVEREKAKTLAELLFHFTLNDFWLSPLSIEHAAGFLTVEFDNEISDLAEMQRQNWLKITQDRKLIEVYSQNFNKRQDFLQKWFFDEKTRKDLGEFPLELSKQNALIISEKIEQNLRSTEGVAINYFPKQTPNKKIYAKAAIEYFLHHPHRLTFDQIAKISPLLSSVERTRLEKLLLQNEVSVLPVDADIETALRWATENYFPFRTTQTANGNSEKADVLAESFSDWLLENYPKMAFGDYENSPLNLRPFYTVKKLIEDGFWVLWIVVDGLNFPNHQRLLQLLGDKSANLRVLENSPVFAVLPTITSRAKYGLTSGKFPDENTKRDWTTKTVFSNCFPFGIYASSTALGKLSEGLNKETPTVCYWNYLKIDDCYHDETDLISIQHEVEAQIQSLAAKINHLVESAHDKNRVAVVICSDHGQMISNCRKSNFDVTGKDTHGRTALDTTQSDFDFANSAYLKTNNGETVCLNPTSFRLSEPTTIALGSTYFVDFKNANAEAVGVHGGLFPEEAVIGLAVLMRDPAHKKLSAEITGNGETGNTGKILLTVDNPNGVTVNPLSITVENLAINEQGELLLAKIAPKDVGKFEIPIEKFPAPNNGEEFEIKGVLQYEFDDGTKEECPITGKLICQSLYTAKNPSLLNRFKK